MAYAVENTINTKPSSITRARGTLTRAVYLKRVKRLLDDSPSTIITQLEEIRAALCHFSNFRVLVIANIEKLLNPVSTWKYLTANLDVSKPLNPLETRISRLSDVGKTPGNTAFIVPLPTIDSSFVISVSKGPSSLEDPNVPALMVALAYLDAVEGPLWTAVRGTGLAYGTSFSRHTDSGQISFDVFRSPDAYKAFYASKDVVSKYVSGHTSFDELALEGAISSIVLAFANGEATMASAAQSSFVRQVIRGLPGDWNETMLKRVRGVNIDEIKKVMRQIVLPVFKPEHSNLIITCAPIMEQSLVKDFARLGFKPQVRSLVSFQDDYGLKTDASDDEDDEGDENDEGETEAESEPDELVNSD